MAKVRVYELAKELGVESKTLLNHLKEQGEFVRSASSTIEPPVVRKIKETFPAELRGGGDGKAAEAKPAAKPAARKAPAKPEPPRLRPQPGGSGRAGRPSLRPLPRPPLPRPRRPGPRCPGAPLPPRRRPPSPRARRLLRPPARARPRRPPRHLLPGCSPRATRVARVLVSLRPPVPALLPAPAARVPALRRPRATTRSPPARACARAVRVAVAKVAAARALRVPATTRSHPARGCPARRAVPAALRARVPAARVPLARVRAAPPEPGHDARPQRGRTSR